MEREDSNVEDLSRMFRLFSKISRGLEPISNMFKTHDTNEGSALVKQAEDSASNKKPEKKDMGHTLFHKALKEAFEVFCNKGVSGSSSAELLATFCDNILKKDCSEKLSDEAIEDALKKEQTQHQLMQQQLHQSLTSVSVCPKPHFPSTPNANGLLSCLGLQKKRKKAHDNEDSVEIGRRVLYKRTRVQDIANDFAEPEQPQHQLMQQQLHQSLSSVSMCPKPYSPTTPNANGLLSGYGIQKKRKKAHDSDDSVKIGHRLLFKRTRVQDTANDFAEPI